MIGGAAAAMGFGLVQAFWLNKDVPPGECGEIPQSLRILVRPRIGSISRHYHRTWSAVGESFGAQGAIAGAIVVGLVDVDSAHHRDGETAIRHLVARGGAAYAVLAAVASDTVSKVAIGAVISRGRFAVQIGIMAGLCLSVGAAILGLTLVLPGVR